MPFDQNFKHIVDGLSPQMRALAEFGLSRKFKKRQLLTREGETSPAVFILLSGTVNAVATRANGHAIKFSSYGPGDVFGEVTLDGGPWLASVVALEPVECLVIPTDRVIQYAREHPDLTLDVMKRVIAFTRRITLATKKMALLDVYQRLVSFLAELSGSEPTYPLEITGITHKQIAEQIGASRVMVSRLLKDLEKGNYLDIQTRRLLLKRALPKHW